MGYADDLLKTSFELVDVNNWWIELIDPEKKLKGRWEEFPSENEAFPDFDPIVYNRNIPWGESHVAELIAEKFHNLVEYSPDMDSWFVWDGRVHLPVKSGMIADVLADTFYRSYERALDFVQTWLELEGEKLAREGKPDSKKRQERLAKIWEKDYAEHKKLRNRLRGGEARRSLAKDIRTRVWIPEDRYSDDTRWFVVQDGVFDCDAIRAGEKPVLLDHCASRPVSRWFNAEYGNNENLGHWDDFLESSIPDDDAREFVKVALGAAFSGNVKLRSYLIFLGEPSSGKSLFLETMDALGSLGSGYVLGNASSESIIEQKNGKNFSRASFSNRRLIGVSEPDSSHKLDGDFIKEFTGDRKVTFEAKYGQPTPDIAQGLIIIASNSMPRMDFSDSALINRTKPIPFPYSFVPNPIRPHEKQRNDDLGDLLLEDGSRILRWIIEGMHLFYTEYRALETSAPATVNIIMEEEKMDRQTPLRWAEEMIEEGGLHFETNEDLLEVIGKTQDKLSLSDAMQSYQAWVVARGEGPGFGKFKFRDMILREYGLGDFTKMEKCGQMRFPTLFTRNSFSTITGRFIAEADKY